MMIKDRFTPIESQIIHCIVNEMPNKQIAQEMNYSQRMIEYYINKIAKKFEVHTRVGIVVRAFREDLIQ